MRCPVCEGYVGCNHCGGSDEPIVSESSLNDRLCAVLEELESVANFLRGAFFDQRIPPDTRDAMKEKAEEIDRFCEQYTGT